MTLKTNCAIKSIRHDLSELKYPICAIIALVTIILFYLGGGLQYITTLIKPTSGEIVALVCCFLMNSVIIYAAAFEPEKENSKKLINIIYPIGIVLFINFIVWMIYEIVRGKSAGWPNIEVILTVMFGLSILAMILLRAYARCINGEKE